jgi:hypothetical protein
LKISVVDPVSSAFEHTKLVLFSPFDLEKWLVMAFSAWLAFLGETGSLNTQLNWNFPGRKRGGGPADELEHARLWLLDHLDTILFAAAIVIPLFIVLTLVLYWVSSRMKFVFVDGVVRNRAAVVQPWRDYRAAGNSLFVFRVVLGMAILLVLALLLWMTIVAIWPMVRTGDFSAVSVAMLILLCLGFITLGFLAALIQLAVNDIVVPIMYVRGCGVGAAWREAGGLIGVHSGVLILYILFRIVLSVAIGLVVFLATCATCCIAMLPYVGTVILLPLYVFVRSYALHFFSQFDPAFAVLGPKPDELPTIT